MACVVRFDSGRKIEMSIKIIGYADGLFIGKTGHFKEYEPYFDGVKIYGRHDLDDDFKTKNEQVLKQKEYAGLALWKPYIILKELMQGNNVFYSDAGDYIFNPKEYRQTIEAHFKNNPFPFLVRGNFINKDWTKRDCFILMGSDSREYYDTPQLEAGQCGFTPAHIPFVMTWLNYNSVYHIASKEPSVFGADFYDNQNKHRSDQSILTNLAARYKLPYWHIESILSFVEYNKFDNITKEKQ